MATIPHDYGHWMNSHTTGSSWHPCDSGMASASSDETATYRGLLATCWQPSRRRWRKRLYVLVGVTGIEPVTSAV
jgi:hypothetical protein